MAKNNSWKGLEASESGDYDEPVDQLEEFRRQWQAEVASKKEEKNREKPTVSAVDLYYRGMKSESDGCMSTAIHYYRQAIHINPDVEELVAKIDQLSVPQASSSRDKEPAVNQDEHYNNSNLLERFSHILSRDEIVDKSGFLNLPAEVLCLIIRWVASSDLDMRSIENLSETCTKLYVYCHDKALWKAACDKVWGMALEYRPYSSWRNMFIKRARVLLDGVYISLVSFFESTESSSFGTTYNPYRCIEYYRYMRFFSNGQMIHYTTPEHPTVVIPSLTFKNAERMKFRVGPYTMHHPGPDKNKSLKISAELQDAVKKTSTNAANSTNPSMRYVVKGVDYHMELELTTTKSRKNLNNKLSWLQYSLYYKFNSPQRNYLYKIPMREDYPPLHFHRVKSYNNVSVEPL